MQTVVLQALLECEQTFFVMISYPTFHCQPSMFEFVSASAGLSIHWDSL